jgi:excisionase family DNA binding protein
MADDILTPQEAADVLKVSASTITRLCARGELQHVRIGKLVRIRREWLDAYLDRGSNGSDGVSNAGATVQQPIGPARKYPGLRGGIKRGGRGAKRPA